MRKAAGEAGVNLVLRSGFRTNDEQAYLYNCYQTKSCNNGNLAARPGTSQHQNGIALDIAITSSVYAWLTANAQRFGFARTVRTENWHWELHVGQACNFRVSYACQNGQFVTGSGEDFTDVVGVEAGVNTPCESRSGNAGVCQDYRSCTGSTESGLCPGSANIKCCFGSANGGAGVVGVFLLFS